MDFVNRRERSEEEILADVQELLIPPEDANGVLEDANCALIYLFLWERSKRSRDSKVAIDMGEIRQALNESWQNVDNRLHKLHSTNTFAIVRQHRKKYKIITSSKRFLKKDLEKAIRSVKGI